MARHPTFGAAVDEAVAGLCEEASVVLTGLFSLTWAHVRAPCSPDVHDVKRHTLYVPSGVGVLELVLCVELLDILDARLLSAVAR